MNPIAQQLRREYHKSGKTYEQIAGLADICPSSVHRALNDGAINTTTLLRICGVFRCVVKIEHESL